MAAEYAAIAQEWLYPTPAGLADADAAALALVGITAHLGLFRCARLASGESVYVPGGAGGVGSMVVQMAKAVGARVATSAGSPQRVALCRDLGADLALDYKTDDIPSDLRGYAPEGIDVWYETQREPNLEVSIPLLHRRGRMVLTAGRTALPRLPLGSFYTRDCSLFGLVMFNASPSEQRECADAMTRWVTEGKLKALIGAKFPLDQMPEAQRLHEENTLGHEGTVHGKIVVTIT